MSKTYVIQWKSKVNGRAGKGTKLFDIEEAEALAAELNQEYPDIHHEVLDMERPMERMAAGLSTSGSNPASAETEPDQVPENPTPALTWSE